MGPGHAAEMSVVIVTPDRYETIRGTIAHLQEQTVRNRLEIVIVAPTLEELGVDRSDFTCFNGLEIVQVGSVTSSAAARAVGVRAAHAPVVAFVEDHSYPAPGWAEILIDDHCRPWAAVGPAMANANPQSLISWANLLIEYSPWLEATHARVINHLPGHNSSYKRNLLLAYGPRLETILEAETILQWDLQSRGHELFLEAATKMYHLNMTRLRSSLSLRFHSGRLFAAARARGWTPQRRLLYTGGAPLIPLVRLCRILSQLSRSRTPPGVMPWVLPALVAGLTVDGVGEMVGYAFGAGTAVERSAELEFHRDKHLIKGK